MSFTTLIPAFKPGYLNELLAALRAQTLRPVRVIFSDDSPDQTFVQRLAQPEMADIVRALNIEVIPGPRLGPWPNCQHLLRHYQDQGATPYFHLLMDDDIPYPAFYRRHLEAHQSQRGHAVVSRRWSAQESGLPFGDLPVPTAVASHPHRTLSLASGLLFEHLVGAANNWLGELSNASFRASMAAELLDPQLAGIRFSGLEDIGSFLMAAQHAPLAYLNEHLGFFRSSPQQNTAQPMTRTFKLGVLAWIPLAMAGEKLGSLSAERAQGVIAAIAESVQRRYGKEADMADFCALMPALIQGDLPARNAFLALWQGQEVTPVHRAEQQA